MGALVVRLRDEHLGGPAQIAIGRQAGIGKLLRGADAMLGEHYHQQFGVHERARVKEFHPPNSSIPHEKATSLARGLRPGSAPIFSAADGGARHRWRSGPRPSKTP